MEWKYDHDVVFCREILGTKPYQFKAWTVESGGCWGNIADHLNECQNSQFKVTKRAFCDHYKILTDKYKKKMREKGKASGIEVESQSELDQLLQNVIEEEEAMECAMEVGMAKGRKIEEDMQKAEDIRMKAMAKIAKTRKWKKKVRRAKGCQ